MSKTPSTLSKHLLPNHSPSALDKDGATSGLAHESSAESAVKIKEKGQYNDKY